MTSVLIALVAGIGIVVGQASAATALGTLTFNPPTGLASSPINLQTVSTGATPGCPSPATNIKGYISGPGAWQKILAVNNSSTDVSNTAEFTFPLADTMGGIAQSNGIAVVPGQYTLTVQCLNKPGTVDYGSFTGSIWFTSATAYQSTDPAGPTPTPTPTPTTPPTTPPTSTTVPPTSATPTVTAATSVSLSVSPAGTAAAGAGVTLTAAVAPTTATGSVTFYDGTTALGSAETVGGQATLSTAALAVGVHSLTAQFTGSGGFGSATSAAVSYTITAAAEPPVVGTLNVLPPTGQDISPINFDTVSAAGRSTKGCPSPATHILGYVYGPGGWATGIPVTNNESSVVSQTEDFSFSMSDTFSGIALVNNLTIVPGRYDFKVYCRNLLGTVKYGVFTTSIWFTDATHYQANDPNNSQTLAEIALAVTPADRADLGTKVTLKATLTPSAAAGTVQFRNGKDGAFTSLGSPVTVAAGTASFSSSSLPFGLYQLSAVFTPTDAAKYTAATSQTVVFVVAKPPPPKPTGPAKIRGSATVGKKLTCSSSFSGADKTTYRWTRDTTTSVGKGSSYRVVRADKGHKLRCVATATNEGGSITRTSKSVQVKK